MSLLSAAPGSVVQSTFTRPNRTTGACTTPLPILAFNLRVQAAARLAPATLFEIVTDSAILSGFSRFQTATKSKLRGGVRSGAGAWGGRRWRWGRGQARMELGGPRLRAVVVSCWPDEPQPVAPAATRQARTATVTLRATAGKDRVSVRPCTPR